MNVSGFVDALDQMGKALGKPSDPTSGLGPGDLPIHLLPMFGDHPVAAPCILVGWPQLSDPVRAAGAACGAYWTATFTVTVLGENTRAEALPMYLDLVMAQLVGNGRTVTDTTTDPYQVPDTPAGIPAVTLTVE